MIWLMRSADTRICREARGADAEFFKLFGEDFARMGHRHILSDGPKIATFDAPLVRPAIPFEATEPASPLGTSAYTRRNNSNNDKGEPMPWRKLPPEIQKELLRGRVEPPPHPLSLYEALQRYYDAFHRPPPMGPLLDREDAWIVTRIDRAISEGIPISVDEFANGGAAAA
jgi:hypothetical protein